MLPNLHRRFLPNPNPLVSLQYRLSHTQTNSNATVRQRSTLATTIDGYGFLPVEAHPSSTSIDFSKTKTVFESKSTSELIRAWAIFKLCGYPLLVKNSSRIVALSERILGDRITYGVMKPTLFSHFCGGENEQELKPTVEKLHSLGVRPILAYAAEADIPEQSHRTELADQETERVCDANTELNLRCIRSVAALEENGFTQIKITALCSPSFLQHMSSILTTIKTLFASFDGSTQEHTVGGLEKHVMEQQVSRTQFIAGLKAGGLVMSDVEVNALFNSIDTNRDGTIDVIKWLNNVSPLDLSLGALSVLSGAPETLTPPQVEKLQATLGRLEVLATAASAGGVRLMVDAEQSYMQPAIDYMVLHMQRRFNTERAVVYNTKQCYLVDTCQRLEVELERARREGWKYGVKMVRGAYLVQERQRALDQGYVSPIQPSLQATHDNYHRVLDMMLLRLHRCEVLVAGHNEDSVKYAVGRMEELGVARRGGGVYFGQLMGMCDHVSLALGAAGYQVYKYVPYGPVKEVMPYLIRRAEENADVVLGSRKDLVLLTDELRRRAVAL